LFDALAGSFDPRRDRLRRMVARWASLYGKWSPLYHIEIEGRSHFPRSGAYVVVANHESGLDTLLLLMLGTPARFLAEHWLFHATGAGWLMRTCRHIEVKVGDRESGHRALEEAVRALAEGSPVAIFPEGRYDEGVLNEFRPGAFVTAKRTGAAIVPVLIEGSGRAWRPGTLVVHGRHTIRLVVSRPITAEIVEAETVEELIERTRKQLEVSRHSTAPNSESESH